VSTNNADEHVTEQRGFEYRGRFYKLPGVDDFRAGDPALFNEATGLRWLDFLEAMVAIEDEDEDALPDIDVTLVLDGMMAVAIWQANPRWRRDKALHFFQSMKKSEIEMLMPDEEDETEDSAQNEEEVPLPTPGAEPSSSSPSPSTNGSEDPSTTSSPSGSGTPASATGATSE
jgi:hypothetical protein